MSSHLTAPLREAIETTPEAGAASPLALHGLLAAARHNEAALRKFQTLELDLLACDSLTDLVHLLLREAPPRLQWDVVSLQLHDPLHEMRQALLDTRADLSRYPGLVWVEREHVLAGQCRGEPRPLLGAYSPSLHDTLYCHAGRALGSVALLALRRGCRWLGSYNIGSHDPQRFHASLATDFLQHLTAVVAVCLENAVSCERLKRLGHTDALTGVGNRRYFDQRLREELTRVQRTGAPLCCLFVDVDHFKAVNDIHGHAMGDEVLRTVAQRIRAQLRSADILARYGGEEFAVLLPQANGERAREVAERIRRCIAASACGRDGARALNVTVSIGAAEVNRESEQAATWLLERADIALYRAKQRGRNRVVFAGGTSD